MKLTELVKNLFSEEAFTLKAVHLKPRDGIGFPKAFQLVPQSEEDDWRIMEVLGIEADRLPIVFPVTGLLLEDGDILNYHLRVKGNVVFGFPANRWTLIADKKWRPSKEFIKGTVTLAKNGGGYVSGHHSLTGQRIVPGNNLELPEPDSDGKIVIDMTGKALRPTLVGGCWVVDTVSRLEELSANALAAYDDVVAEEQKKHQKEDFRSAKEFYFPNGPLTVFELFGAPLGKTGQAAKSITEFDVNGQHWLDRARTWERRALLSALHPDNWPKDLSSDEKQRAKMVANKTKESVEEAIDWATKWLLYSVARRKSREASGLSVRLKLPSPKGREHRQEQAVISLEIEELRQRFMTVVVRIDKPATPAEVPTTETVTTGKTNVEKPSNKPAGKAKAKRQTKAEPHIKPQERTVATSGEDTPNSIGDLLKPDVTEKLKKLNGNNDQPKETKPFEGAGLKAEEIEKFHSIGVRANEELARFIDGNVENLSKETGISKRRLKAIGKKLPQS
ncbi:MAG: hypothetical protein WCV58_03290 [Patescibacteria group bacterium]